MYAWIWRHLPGPFAVRVGLAVVLAAAVVALLFGVVFPYAEAHVPSLVTEPGNVSPSF